MAIAGQSFCQKRLKVKQTAKSAPPVFTIHKENVSKINNLKSIEKSSVSYADALRSSGASTNTSENSVGLETCFQTLTPNSTTFCCGGTQWFDAGIKYKE